MNCLRLLKRFWQALPLSDQTRWLLTSRLLEPLLQLTKKNSVIYTAYLREKEWHIRRVRPFCGQSLPELPAQVKTDVIIWGIIDWRFRTQRPQHLARGLASAGYRVFYISPVFVNTRRSGFELERLNNDGTLYNLRFHLKDRRAVSAAPPNDHDIMIHKANLTEFLRWTKSGNTVSIVQHPYWHEPAKHLPKSRVIYDCMDHHEGFGNTGVGIVEKERSLLRDAEAVITTSQFLYDFASTHNPNVTLIRNGTEFDFFSATPELTFKDPLNRVVLGYYGAIAEWIDTDLLEKVAIRFPDCLLLLVGADECGLRRRLRYLSNVQFVGEVEYACLPYYLHGFDICLLPFRITPLTLATNPVKVYEYLSAGKPVVSIALPELKQFDELVATATTHIEFIEQIAELLTHNDASKGKQRQDFAQRNTWQNRLAEFIRFLDLD